METNRVASRKVDRELKRMVTRIDLEAKCLATPYPTYLGLVNENSVRPKTIGVRPTPSM